MKLKTKKYKSILSISILTSLGIFGMMSNDYEHIEDNPSSSKPIEQISSGTSHNSLIDSNGDLWMWGDNSYGQLGVETTTVISSIPINISKENDPFDGNEIVQVALGGYHSGAIDEYGNLWMWGDNSRGQLGNGTKQSSSTPINITYQWQSPIFDKEIKQVALGVNHSGAIDSEGNLWMWGYNGYDQLGDVKTTETSSPDPVNITQQDENPIYGETIVQVALSESHSSAIDKNGGLWMWGDNDNGKLGNGAESGWSDPPINITQQEGNPIKKETIVQVALGDYHSGAIDENGGLWMWGNNGFGQLGDGTDDSSSYPIEITHQFGKAEIDQVSLGYYHSSAIDSNGDLWMWGRDDYGQLGDGEKETESLDPINISNKNSPFEGEKIEQVSLGAYFSSALDSKGNLWTWGKNEEGQLGDGKIKNTSMPTNITNQIFFLYNPYVSELGDTSATLNYMLSLGSYEIGDITVQYRSNGGEWSIHEDANNGHNQIELKDLNQETYYNYQIQIIDDDEVLFEPISIEFTTNNSDGLSAGKIIGIVVVSFGSFALIGLAISPFVYFISKRNKSKKITF